MKKVSCWPDMTEDGAIPAEDKFKALGKTYKDTATLETEEGETVACECEEDDDPEDEIYIPGGTTLKYSTSDLDPESCYKALGGELSVDKRLGALRIVFVRKRCL